MNSRTGTLKTLKNQKTSKGKPGKKRKAERRGSESANGRKSPGKGKVVNLKVMTHSSSALEGRWACSNPQSNTPATLFRVPLGHSEKVDDFFDHQGNQNFQRELQGPSSGEFRTGNSTESREKQSAQTEFPSLALDPLVLHAAQNSV